MTGIRVFIEYDFSKLHHSRAHDLEPFEDDHSVWDLAHDELDQVKDYSFYAALAGVRKSENGIEPLFLPRGFPPNCHYFVERELGMGEPPISWLQADELVVALEHANLAHDDLSVPAQLLVETVAHLASRCGNDRVRIVFGFT